MRVILASGSPRRRELLERAGIECHVRPAAIDESFIRDEGVVEYVRRMACEKARRVATDSPAGKLVLGADTVVELNGQVLGKPRDADDAEGMLRLLSGRSHTVLTGICVMRAPDHLEALDHATTRVTFLPLNDPEIRDYIASGEPFDKAGAYGIQGLASRFTARVDGCFFNVVGLPVSLVYSILKSLSPSGS